MVTYVQQDTWGWMLAAYLFLGGLGGALATLSIGIDCFVRPNRRLAVGGALSSIVLLSIGSIILVFDLMQPLKVIYFWMNPSSWIFWGIPFLSVAMICTALYVLPYLTEWPVIGAISKKLGFLAKWQRWTGLASVLFGGAVAAYTGFLLSASQGIALWHTAGLPVLFTLSALSTGCAYLMLVLWPTRHEDEALLEGLAKLDVGLIGAELVVLLGLFNAGVNSGGVGASIDLLLGSMWCVIGFLGFGLAVPLLIELYELAAKRGARPQLISMSLVPVACVFILVGGYLLRHLTLWAGMYSYPW